MTKAARSLRYRRRIDPSGARAKRNARRLTHRGALRRGDQPVDLGLIEHGRSDRASSSPTPRSLRRRRRSARSIGDDRPVEGLCTLPRPRAARWCMSVVYCPIAPPRDPGRGRGTLSPGSGAALAYIRDNKYLGGSSPVAAAASARRLRGDGAAAIAHVKCARAHACRSLRLTRHRRTGAR